MDPKTTLNEQEHAWENELICDLEGLLDKHMVSQEQMPHGWVIDTADQVLQVKIRNH
jgi:hypothetical protein